MNDYDPLKFSQRLEETMGMTNSIRLLILFLVAGFLAITFLQSALDKVFDYKGNLGWMKEQFSKTFLKKTIGIFLPLILLFELATGLLCVIGIVALYLQHGRQILVFAFFLAGVTLLMLLFGQRVSKQYAGAVSLTGYFIITLIGLFVLTTSAF
jgi:hypothetical protein